MESTDVGVVHQERITGITVGLLWDAPVLITYVSMIIALFENLSLASINYPLFTTKGNVSD